MRVLSPLLSPRPLLSLRASPAAMLLDTGSLVSEIGTTLAFADQGNNLAGIFFQASLLPYLGFLYFLGYEGNRCPKTAQFGSQFLLLFVISTVVTGIVTKGQYSETLANVDWLHGSSEALLTTSNLFLGFGLAGTLSTGTMEPADASMESSKLPRYAAGLLALAVFGSAIAGPQIGVGVHDAFLFGAGALPAELLDSFGLPLHAEPTNALSVPTWAIHFSSVFEYLFAMGMVWQMAALSGNPRWKGLTWGMLPLHASGIAACTYHFFYNDPNLQFIVALQAGLTLLGNTTVAIGALRLALSNGWTLAELNPFAKDEEKEAAAAADAGAAAAPVTIDGTGVLPNAAKLVLLTALASYGMKYGELLLGEVPYSSNAALAAAIVAGFPAVTAWRFSQLGSQDDDAVAN